MIISSVMNTAPATLIQRKILEGKAFEASHRATSVASGDYIDIYFENPSDSDTTVHLIVVNVTSLAQGYIDIYKNSSGVSGGTAITPTNLNLSSTNTSVANVLLNPSVTTLGDLTNQEVLPGGSHIRAVGGAAEIGEQRILMPDNNILVRVTNASTDATDLAIGIVWWEE